MTYIACKTIFMHRLFICTIISIAAFSANATDSLYAKKVVDTLSSPYFLGRGYINDGMKKAADYIEQELRSINASPTFSNKFQQRFDYPVNTFPGALSLEINGIPLKPGNDFIVGNESRSVKASGELIKKDSATFVFPDKRIIIKLVDKLTWSVDGKQEDYTSFNILKSAVKGNPQTFATVVDAKLIKSFDANNISGFFKGTAVPDSFLVFTAHYDHLGAMGKDAYFAGANDNASGVALILSLAQYYATHPQRYSVLFIAFAGEEAGLLGSKYFVDHSPINIKKMRFLTNLDLMGNGEEGVTVVNATEFPKEFQLLQDINTKSNYLATVGSRGKAANSDHYWFTEKGIPSFFIYTLGKRKYYHDVDDVASTLPLFEMKDLQSMLIEFNDKLQAR